MKGSAAMSDASTLGAAPPSDKPFDLEGLPSRYRVERLLGRGSQKSVYLALDETLGRYVAVSAVDLQQDQELERLHEARAMARIGDYPNVVTIYDVIEQRDRLYIVSQYVAGGDLARALRDHGTEFRPLQRAVRIGAQICRALLHAHENGVAHLDVKPANIFLDEKGDALLGDFGLSSLSGLEANPAWGFAGTPAYAAPERIRGASGGPRCDLYALGCVLYELVTGRPPLVGEDGPQTLQMHLETAVTPARTRRPEVPRALDELLLRLLAKNPSDRPVSANEILSALEGFLRSPLLEAEGPPRIAARSDALPTGTVWRGVATAPPFVGRAEQLRAFDHILDEVAKGRPRVVFVSGEAGIGKTRLIRELRRRVEDRGALYLCGQAHEDFPVPHGPFLEAISPLAHRISELKTNSQPVLREFLGLGDGQGDPATAHDSDRNRHRLFVALSEALERFAAQTPIVVTLDDLQWADSASLDLFEHIATALCDRGEREAIRLLLVASFRPTDPDQRGGRLHARLAREPLCETLAVTGLEEHELHRLLVGMGIRRPSDQLVHSLHEATGGNPLFASEIVHQLRRDNRIEERRGFAVTTGGLADLEAPPSVSNAIAQRIEDLPHPCRIAVGIASLIGAKCPLPLLAAAMGKTETDIVEALEDAVQAGVLIDEGHRYRFPHPLIRRAVSDQIPAIHRQRLHLEIAECVERGAKGQIGPVALDLAYHLVRAGTSAQPRRVATYATLAADQVLAKFAWREASDLLEAAIAALKGTEDLTSRELGELHSKAALAFFERFDPGPCIEHYDAALACFRQAGDGVGVARTIAERAHAAIQLGLVSYGDTGHIQALEEALSHVGEADRPLRARVLGMLAEAYWAARDQGRAESLANTALELAMELRAHSLHAEISVHVGLTRMQRLEIVDALSAFREGLVHARKCDDPLGASHCETRIALLLCQSGRLSEAEAIAGRITGASHADSSLAKASLAAMAMIRGRWDAAEIYGEEALRLVRRGRYAWSGWCVLVSLAYARAVQADFRRAHEAIDLALEPGFLFDDPSSLEPFLRPYRLLIDAYREDATVPSEASPAASEEADEGAAEDVVLDLALLPEACATVELAGTGGVSRAAVRLVEAAFQRGMIFTPGWPFFVPRIRAEIEFRQHRHADAVRSLERAIQISDELGAKTEQARSRLALARVLGVGEPNRERALSLLLAAGPETIRECPTPERRAAERLRARLETRPV
jgi:tetratricopeptide (TPR) repeat protein